MADDFADEEIDNVSIKVEKPELIVCPNRTGSVKSSSNQLALIEKKSSKNLQVAVVDDEKNSEVIKLNKMIAHIKRIDLPKFQPELHQICQYGSDVKLLDLYSDVCVFFSFLNLTAINLVTANEIMHFNVYLKG